MIKVSKVSLKSAFGANQLFRHLGNHLGRVNHLGM